MFLEVIQQGVGIELLGQLKTKTRLCTECKNLKKVAHQLCTIFTILRKSLASKYIGLKGTFEFHGLLPASQTVM